MLRVYAEGNGNGNGTRRGAGNSQNRPGGTVVRPASQQRRGAEGMGSYIRREGSIFGRIQRP